MIYLLTKNLRMSAQSLCDQHLNETILDAAMAISFYLWEYQKESVAFDAGQYFTGSKGRPQQLTSEIPRALFPLRGSKDLYDWITLDPSNYTFLIQYLIELTNEYEFRFVQQSKIAHIIRYLPKLEFESVVSNQMLERRISACKDLYKQPPVTWMWTTRKRP